MNTHSLQQFLSLWGLAQLPRMPTEVAAPEERLEAARYRYQDPFIEEVFARYQKGTWIASRVGVCARAENGYGLAVLTHLPETKGLLSNFIETAAERVQAIHPTLRGVHLKRLFVVEHYATDSLERHDWDARYYAPTKTNTHFDWVCFQYRDGHLCEPKWFPMLMAPMRATPLMAALLEHPAAVPAPEEVPAFIRTPEPILVRDRSQAAH